jgi:trans-aconitate 2-methyltransferase
MWSISAAAPAIPPDFWHSAGRLSSFGAQWIEADIAGWSPDTEPDVIFSNAALHWLPDHAALLPRLISFLKPGGVLAFQVPDNFAEPSHTALRELEQDARWADRILHRVEHGAVLAPEAYHAILEPHAACIDIWETRYLQILDGDDAVVQWTSGTALRPYLKALEGEAREEFLAAYRTRMVAAYPRQPSGKTLFAFKRLFAVVRR